MMSPDEMIDTSKAMVAEIDQCGGPPLDMQGPYLEACHQIGIYDNARQQLARDGNVGFLPILLGVAGLVGAFFVVKGVYDVVKAANIPENVRAVAANAKDVTNMMMWAAAGILLLSWGKKRLA